MTLQERILGIDYGTKRIGIAISDPLNIIAQGLQVIPNSPRAIEEIKRLVLELNVKCIVVGMPLNLKGERGMKGQEVSAFIEQLRQESGIEVIEWDERFTTRTAHQTLRTMGVKKQARRSKEKIDEIASALILQGYLDKQRRQSS